MTTTQYDNYYIATFDAQLTNRTVIGAFVMGSPNNRVAFVGFVDSNGRGRVNCLASSGVVIVRVVYI